jgi:subtilisin family serine protease
MHRRIASLFLAVLIGLPIAAPAGAAEPLAQPADPSVAPTPIPDPTAVPEPTPAPDPTASPDPTPTPSAVPTQPPDQGTEPPPPAVGTATRPTDPEVVGAGRPAGAPDPTGRWIVMLKNGANTTTVLGRASKRDGVKADRTFARALRGFAANLDAKQRTDLLADPSVAAVVPDGIVQVTQTVPTGVARVGGQRSDVASIDGVDQRVDADVAIVDTGISPHPDLNVAGGYNCSTADHSAWHDNNDHGTHVAGIVGALDNTIGVVGVAPGARVWGVKILNADGYGLISWYICGLDWILAQRDPVDPTRPLFEAVNMSVTKAGSDDHDCGFINNDPLHQAICRVVAGGITVVAAAANDSHNAAKNIPASYDEVITVSALADTDGRPGGLGGNRCYSWGGYDQDDTFADFSNYGADVDIMAPGKCIMSTVPGGGYRYMSGTSMAAPTVTGAVALYKSSRPDATPAEVKEALRYLGNLNWKTSTDPDPYHEPLLDVSRIGELGTFAFAPAAAPKNVEAGTTVLVPVTITRSATFFERVQFKLTSLPAGWSGSAAPSVFGWTANTSNLTIRIPAGTPLGAYEIGVQATNQGRLETTTVPIQVVTDDPTAGTPVTSMIFGEWIGLDALRIRVSWPAGSDPTSGIAGYEVESSRAGGAWGSTIERTAIQREAGYVINYDGSYRFRVRARDAAGNWSPWKVNATATKVAAFDDRSSAISRSGSWSLASVATAWGSTLLASTSSTASLTWRFTGRAVAVVAPMNARLGSARLYVDGRYVKTVSLRSSVGKSRQIVYTGYFSGGGRHTLTIRPTGSGPNRIFEVDAFLVTP